MYHTYVCVEPRFPNIGMSHTYICIGCTRRSKASCQANRFFKIFFSFELRRSLSVGTGHRSSFTNRPSSATFAVIAIDLVIATKFVTP